MPRRSTLALACFVASLAAPGEAFWNTLSPALERAASYGYYMLGYGPPEHGYSDVDFPIDAGTIWNGHIPVGDFVSPIVSALGVGEGGYNNRVVKGYENRLGLRIAVPYLGDFQVTREVGPGRFTDKLGPGKFPYPGLKGVRGQHHHEKGYDDGVQHRAPKPTTKAPDMYNSLRNYPWYRR